MSVLLKSNLKWLQNNITRRIIDCDQYTPYPRFATENNQQYHLDGLKTIQSVWDTNFLYIDIQ